MERTLTPLKQCSELWMVTQLSKYGMFSRQWFHYAMPFCSVTSCNHFLTIMRCSVTRCKHFLTAKCNWKNVHPWRQLQCSSRQCISLCCDNVVVYPYTASLILYTTLVGQIQAISLERLSRVRVNGAQPCKVYNMYNGIRIYPFDLVYQLPERLGASSMLQ